MDGNQLNSNLDLTPTPAMPDGGGSLNAIPIISSAPDKPKVSRPLILGIILGVLVLIGGSVGAVFLLNSGKNTTSVGSSASLYAAVSNYAVHIVGSEEEFNEDFDLNKTYAINEVLRDGSESDQELYFNEAIQKYNEVIAQYGKLQLSNANFNSILNNNLENLEFMQLYVGVNILTGEEIYQKSLSDGKDATKEYVANYYSNFTNSPSVSANNFAELAISFGETIIDDSSEDASKELTEIINKTNSLVNSTVNNLIDGCWTLRSYTNTIQGASQ